MNRQQRREAERKQARMDADFRTSLIGQRIEHKAAVRQAAIDRLSRNGITPADMEAEYKRGYDNARKELTRFTVRMFYCAAALSLHEQFGFGESRIFRVLDRIQEIMCEELGTVDIAKRLKDETGIKIFETEYDN